MARIDRYHEAQAWLNDWLACVRRGSSYARRRIKEAAVEQRHNLESIKRYGHSGWCNVAEYERSVKMIENAANEL